MEFFKKFLGISAHKKKTIEEMVKDGNIGLVEYFSLTANCLILAFSLLMFVTIFGPIYFLIIRPCSWLIKKMVNI